MAADETQLLREYAATRSDAAFRGLVDRYIGLVHSAARRQVGGDAELAKDVTQAVFLVLAQKASALRNDKEPLAAWLLQVTRFAAANARRKAARREHHEWRAGEMARRENESQAQDPAGGAWDQYSPLLDEGIGKLRAGDRDAIVLRYFEKKDARSIAAQLGISEAAAEKRVSRAVERLRAFFRRRGVVVSAVALATGLIAHSAEAAPLGLSAAVASSASATGAAAAASGVVGGSGAAAVAKGTVVAMAAVKVKSAILITGISLLALAGGTVAVHEMRSPRAHQIELTAQQQGAARLAQAARTARGAMLGRPAMAPPLSLPPLPWSVTFSDGTAVNLVAIRTPTDRAAKWWDADGRPSTWTKQIPRAMTNVDAPGYRLYQFIFEQSPTTSDVLVMFQGESAGGGSGNTDLPGQPRQLNETVALMQDRQTVDMTISCAHGPDEIDWQYDLTKRAVSPPADANGQPTTQATTAPTARPMWVAVDTVTEAKGKTQITMHRTGELPSNRLLSLNLVNTQGKEIGATSITGSMNETCTYEFPLPMKDAVALLSRSRALESQTIHNVSLRSGVRSAVKVSPTPDEPTPTSQPAP